MSNYWILRVKTHLRFLVFANRNQWPWFLIVLPDLHSSSSRSACSNSTHDTINRSNFGYLFRETHPVNGWDLNSPNRITDPQTIEERRQVATECAQAMKYGIRTCMDEIHDLVSTLFSFQLDLQSTVRITCPISPVDLLLALPYNGKRLTFAGTSNSVVNNHNSS